MRYRFRIEAGRVELRRAYSAPFHRRPRWRDPGIAADLRRRESIRNVRDRRRAVYRFTGAPNDAANPFAGLTTGANGALYGAGQYGGAQNAGAIFALMRSHKRYTERLLHSLGGYGDGSYPVPALAIGKDGTFYGSSEYGGDPSSDGTVFSVTAAGSERVLLAFPNGAGGAYPAGGVLVGSGGALFGTASYGGSSSLAARIAFKL
ncbi:MAG: choice-of-anchor tandem repeat GloVer-containing protein [Candidatus Cybelea sp.]